MIREMPPKKINYDSIKTAAASLFLLNGYANTSMSDIAELLNIKKASLYHHLETREKLLLDIIKDIEKSLKNDFVRMKELKNYSEKKEFFLKIMQDFYYHDDQAYLIIKLSHEIKNNVVISSIRQFIEEWIKQLQSLLTQNLDKQTAKEKAENLTYQLIGTLIFSKLTNKKQLLKKSLAQIKELLDCTSKLKSID